MGVLVRAVVSGFGFSLGAAIYKKVSGKLGLEESDANGKGASAAKSANAVEPDEGDVVVDSAIQDAILE